MSFNFSPDIQKSVDHLIASGDYQSEEEVIRLALDLLSRREEELLKQWNLNNQTASDQSKQGLSKPLDEAGLLGRVQSRLSQEGRS